MDSATARLECLKLAQANFPQGDQDKIKTAATAWADFVIGPAIREHANAGKKGADDPK